MADYGYSMPGYFQNMKPIGCPLEEPDTENAEKLKQIEKKLAEERERILAAGRSDEALEKAGQRPAMQRVRLLVEEGSWRPLNSLYNPAGNADGSTGVITGLGHIHGKWAVVIASDNKKLAGAWVAGQALKILRATDIAKRLRIPLVYLLNCSGVKLDEQEKVYAGRQAGGTPFYRHADLQQAGIPVLVGIYGTNPAGGGYHAVSPTVLIAHEKANMAVGGAGITSGMNPKGAIDQAAAQALIDAVRASKKQDPPGSVAIHYGETGFFREVYTEETGVIAALQKYMDALPAYDAGFFRVDEPKPPRYESEEIYSRLPLNPRRAYDMREILARLVDGSSFMEFKKDYGPEIIAGLAKIDGLLCGIVANFQGLLTNYPEYREDAMGVGGKLYRQGLLKMNEFVALCGRDRLPIIWIQDTSGIDVGDPAEKAELLGLGQSLIYSIQSSGVPQMEITLRKGSAAAHYVMGGPQGNDTNAFSLGTAATEIYVMHGETAAAAMYARRLVKEQDSGGDLQPTIDKMNEMVKSYHENASPEFCAGHGLVDEIVSLPDLRGYLQAFVGAAYQDPQSICAFHQMLLPRLIRDWDRLQAAPGSLADVEKIIMC